MIDYTHANAEFLPEGYAWGHLFRRVWLGTYYPPFRAKILRVKAAAAARGAEYVSEFGYRGMALQNDLHTKYLKGLGGKAAPAGLSAHQYGIADDSTADADTHTPGLQPTWEPAAYDILGEEAEREGLVWGASFGDRPHVQWPGYVSGTELLCLRDLWNGLPPLMADDARLLQIWAYLDAHAKVTP